MNLLMVDDDLLVLQDLQEKLDWPALGVDGMFTAQSAEAALQLLERVPVHLVLCDIEMPGTNGLDLLAQLREQQPDLPCIVLTSYARFEYAQRAVQLKVAEYLLKPVNAAQLEEAVRKGAHMARQSRAAKDSQRLGQYWVDERRNIAEAFWQQAARGALGGLHSMAEKLGYTVNDHFVPVLMEALGQEELRQWDAAMLEYAIKNMGYEALHSEYMTPQCVVGVGANRWLAVVRVDRGPDIDNAPLADQLYRQQERIQQAAGLTMCFGVGQAAAFDEMAQALQSLCDLLDGTIDRAGRILSGQAQRPAQGQSAMPEFQLWETLLQNGDGAALLRQMELFLRAQAAALTKEGILAFRQDVAQLVYSFLKQHEIQTHRLFGDGHSDELYRASLRSIEDMLAYCRLLVERSLEYTRFSENLGGVVETVRAYLDAHFAEDIQRADLAGIVYISPDYLSRLFRRETGRSLMQYLNDKRIEAAQQLLAKSSLPINAVALQVGYSSFAYFSKMFRETTGLTPMAYRKQYAGK